MTREYPGVDDQEVDRVRGIERADEFLTRPAVAKVKQTCLDARPARAAKRGDGFEALRVAPEQPQRPAPGGIL
jgi:hypothetical protein